MIQNCTLWRYEDGKSSGRSIQGSFTYSRRSCFTYRPRHSFAYFLLWFLIVFIMFFLCSTWGICWRVSLNDFIFFSFLRSTEGSCVSLLLLSHSLPLSCYTADRIGSQLDVASQWFVCFRSMKANRGPTISAPFQRSFWFVFCTQLQLENPLRGENQRGKKTKTTKRMMRTNNEQNGAIVEPLTDRFGALSIADATGQVSAPIRLSHFFAISWSAGSAGGGGRRDPCCSTCAYRYPVRWRRCSYPDRRISRAG